MHREFSGRRLRRSNIAILFGRVGWSVSSSGFWWWKDAGRAQISHLVSFFSILVQNLRGQALPAPMDLVPSLLWLRIKYNLYIVVPHLFPNRLEFFEGCKMKLDRISSLAWIKRIIELHRCNSLHTCTSSCLLILIIDSFHYKPTII